MSLTVVLTSYNYGCFLSNAIQAIVSQSLTPDEFILIEDGSTDNSLEVIEEFSQRYPIIQTIRHKKNEGILYSLNEGLALSRSDYIVFATADDLVLPSFFEETMKLLVFFPQAGFCSALANIQNDRGEMIRRLPSPIIGEQGFFSPQQTLHLMYRYGYWLVGNTAVFRRKALQEIGGFLPELGPLCDSFASQVLARRYGFCFIPKPLTIVRLSEESFSSVYNRNFQKYVEIIHRANELRLTIYKDIFPPSLSRELKNDLLYTFGVTFWRTNVTQLQNQIITKHLPMFLHGESKFTEWILWGLKCIISLEKLLITSYFFIRYSRLHTWIRRRLHFFHLVPIPAKSHVNTELNRQGISE